MTTDIIREYTTLLKRLTSQLSPDHNILSRRSDLIWTMPHIKSSKMNVMMPSYVQFLMNTLSACIKYKADSFHERHINATQQNIHYGK